MSTETNTNQVPPESENNQPELFDINGHSARSWGNGNKLPGADVLSNSIEMPITDPADEETSESVGSKERTFSENVEIDSEKKRQEALDKGAVFVLDKAGTEVEEIPAAIQQLYFGPKNKN